MGTVQGTGPGTAAAGVSVEGQGHLTGFGTPTYRGFVLTSLMLIYVLNFLDRGLLGVVAEEVMADLSITDGQFGLLTGFGFALFYTLVGIPLAQMAETRHRVWIMTICIALWSGATALSGLANPITIGPLVISGFVVMLICRLLVGVGEAGCTPPANSLIADYYPPAKRAQALGFYGMGVTLGTMSANLIGGPVADNFGWRTAFIVIGLAGVLVAVLFKLAVREPPRGYSDPPGMPRPERAGLGAAMKELSGKPAFWLMATAATMAAFCGYGQTTFQTSFIRRTFTDLSLTEVTLFFNAPASLAASVSVFMTGFLATKLVKRYPSAVAWLPGLGIMLAVPFYFVAYTAENRWVCLTFLMLGALVKYGYIGSQYTIGQGVVGLRTRATAIAILLFVVNLIGYGLGPLFIGAVSDVLFTMKMNADGFGDVARAVCRGASFETLDAATQAACRSNDAESLRDSLMTIATMHIIPGVFFFLCARRLQSDLVAR
ncbi:MFS transporter [bacterium]|nr:MFS transporter [bacterium]